MTGHMPEERLVSLRDGTDDAEGLAHLDACAACRDALEALRLRAAAVSAALGALDAGWDTEAARARVRQRVAEAAAARAGTPSVVRRRSLFTVASLSRAAGILLVTAAAASALPGSPVRRWLTERIGSEPVAATAPAPAEQAPTAATASETTGVRVSVPAGPLSVVLRDVAAGSEVRVVLVPGTEAAVYAPAGSRFTSATGRVEARVAPGEVRVELPRGVESVSLEVGGRIYLRSSGEGLDVPGPVTSRSDDEIVFRIPG